MKALVLAAGEGVRMGPLTENRPKPMLPVAGRPFIEHTILALKEASVDEIFILTGYRGSAIKEHFGEGEKLGVRINYLIQPERLGTAHAIGMASDSIKEPFLCLNGDVIVNRNIISNLISIHEREGGNVMTLIEVKDASRFGLVRTEDGVVKEIVEKPKGAIRGAVNGGIYLFTPGIFEMIEKTPLSTRGEYEITRSIELLMKKEEIRSFTPAERWVDIGSPWDLLRAHEIYMDGIEERIEGTIEEGVYNHGTMIIEEGAVVRSGTYIEGNVIIGRGAVIGPNSYIRGSTYVGPGSRIGAASEVKNSIILENTNIPHHNYVGDSIIGSDCNLGSGTKVANLRLDEGPVSVVLKGEKVSSGRRKLGVIMGDNVKTGINATIDPGSMIFSGTLIGPGTRVSGTLGRDSRIF